MEPNSTLRLPFETTPSYYTDEVFWIVDTDDQQYLTVENGTVKSKSKTTPADHPVAVHVYIGDEVHATCHVHIRKRVSSVTINKATASVDVGTTLQLTASVSPYNVSNNSVTWSSSDESIATVDENGLVYAVAKGSCEIRATAADGSGAYGICTITVPNNLYQVQSIADFQSPHPYQKGTADIWIYQEDDAEYIRVTFSAETKLDNYGYDRIVIKDGNGNQVGEYKKSELAGQSVLVPGNTVWLKLAAAANSVGSNYGFSVESLDAMMDLQSYIVRYNGNGATGGRMEKQKIRRDTYATLTANAFERDGYYFTGWNTSATGTGTGYEDRASVRNIAAGGEAVTLYAQWSPNAYSIRYDANGGTGDMDVSEALCGETVTLRANSFVNAGYRFVNWNTEPDGSGTSYADRAQVIDLVTENNGSLTLYAQWAAITYQIRYRANGGSGSMASDTVAYDRSFTLKPNIFTRTGYHFSHWNTAADGNGDSYDDEDTVQGLAEVQGSIVTLYAQWDPNTYAVQYSANGGSGTMEDSDAVYGEGLTLRANTFTRTGYHFTGWNTRSDGNGTAYADQAQVLNLVSVQDGSITLYAQWAVNTYTVRYQANGGSGSMSATNATYGVSFQLRANTFTRTGYHFTGWNTQSDGQGSAYADKAVVRDLIDSQNGMVTMYAQWAANTYTVKYAANGGRGTMTNSSAVYGEGLRLRKNTFTRSGYHFTGWNTAAAGTGTSYADEADVMNLVTTQGGSITLYAQWAGNTYTVTFDPCEGETVTANKEVTYGGTYGALPEATRTGYSFQGWYTAATGGSQVTAQTAVTKAANHTLYARWLGEMHTLTFVFGTATPADENGQALSSADQARVKTRQVRYGERYDAYDEYGLWPNAIRSGYDFAGWYTASTGGDPVSPTDLFMELQDQSLYPHWTPKTFAVRFNANGTGATVDPAGKNVTYGAAYGELPTPERFGYTFDGWYTLAEGGAKKTEGSLVTADEEHTLYAHWTPLEAKVNFDAGEGQTTESFRYVAYDSAYGGSTALPRPVRTGYDFTGWYTASTGGTEVKDTTVCKQVEEHTLYARWKAATYTVRFNSLGGSSARQITVTYAGKYGTLPVSTRTGYDFAGWYTAETGGSEVTKDTVVTTAAAHTLYARWNAHAYQIVYDGNGGTGLVEPQDAVYGTETALAANGYEKTGYHFTGWNTQANGKGAAYAAGAGVTGLVATDGGSITLYAQWAANTYRVTLDARGGELTDNTLDVTYDATYAGLPAEVNREGYTFTGWYTAAEDGDAVTAATAMTTASDHTLYAHWQPVACVLLFDANGGSVDPESKLVDYETAYGELPTPGRKGYRFTGWYTAAENGEAVSAETVATVLEEVTLFACWEANSYNVSFDPGEGIAAIDGRTVTYDQVYGELPVPVKEHYDFVGWFTDSARDVQDGVEVRADTVLAIDSAHTLYARWAPHLYRVVFRLRGGLFDRLESLEYTVPYQSSLADAMTDGLTEGEANALAAEKPVRTKYRFAGWTLGAGPGTALGDTLETVWADPALANITADHTIYADWTVLYATAAPVISVAEEPAAADGAVIASDTHILLTCAARDARIYYTTNGDDPTAESTLYTGEIPAESIAVRIQGAQPGEPGRQVTIRAIAVADGHAESAVTAAVYKLAEDAEDWGDVTAADQAYFAAHGATGTAADVPAGLWIAPVADQFYTGANITLSAEALRVYDGKRLLTAGTDYSVSHKNNKEPGTATVTVTGKGNYNGSLTGNFTIAKRSQAATKPFAKAVITYDRNVAYNADAAASASGIVPGQTGPVVTYNGVALHEAERDANGDPVNGDYFIVYENNRNAGTATMTVTGIGEYYGMQSKTYTITGTAISRCVIDGFDTNATVYTGQPQTKSVRIYTDRNKQTLLTEAAKDGQGEYLRDANGCYVDGEGRITGDYIVSYEKNTDAGTAAMIVTGIGNYTGTWKKTWSIKAYDLKTDPEHRIRVTDETGAAWPAAAPYKETAYAKGGAKPEPVVWFATAFEEDGVTPEAERQLTAGVDYTLSWTNNTAVNDGSNAAKLPAVKITGKGDLTGIRQDLYFTVAKQSLAAADADGTPLLTLDAQDVVYKGAKKNYTTSFKLYDVNGTALAAADYDAKSVKYYYTEDTDLADGTFRHGGYVLENGVRDWTGSEVQADDMVPAGTTLRITVDAKEGEKALYTGTAEGTYRIVTGDVGKATVKVANQFYTGREVRPGKEEITVTISGSVLTQEDYEIVSYENNVSKGTAKLTIRGRGDYGGTKTATYSIAVRPMTTTIRYDGNGATAGTMREMKVTTLGTDAKPVCLTDNAFKRTGYTFAGWCRRKSGAAGDADYYATDGSKTDPVDLRLVIPALPEGEGGLITLYAQWIPVKYSITWHTNGGENHPDNLDLRRVTGYADEADALCYNADTPTVALLAPDRAGWPVGYQFGGWYRENTYKNKIAALKQGTTGDLDLWAKWIPYTYQVCFNGNGATNDANGDLMPEEGFSYGVRKALTANKYKRGGYVFLGWSGTRIDPAAPDAAEEIAAAAICADKQPVTEADLGIGRKNNGTAVVTLYAVWQQTFTVTYDTDGGTRAAGDSYADSYRYGQTYRAGGRDYGLPFKLPAPVRAGYGFDGWYGADGKKVTQIAKNTTGDLQLTARWTPYAYSVKFDGNGKNSGNMTAQKFVYGQEAPLAHNQYVRNGMVFLGWSVRQTDQGNAAAVQYADGQVIDGSGFAAQLNKNNQSVTLYAVWRRAVLREEFALTYHTRGEETIPDTYRYGTGKAALAAAPAQDGCTFAGWYRDEACKNKVTSISGSEAGDIDLWAKWTGGSYTVTFTADAPADVTLTGRMAQQKLTYLTSKALNANGYKVKGYDFLGWSTESAAAAAAAGREAEERQVICADKEAVTGEGLVYTDGNVRTADNAVTLYGVWKKAMYHIVYMNMEGVENRNPAEFTIDSPAIDLGEPALMGNTFLGWYSDAACRKQVTQIAAGTAGDQTLYAKWLVHRYTICYDLNDGLFGHHEAVLDTSRMGYITSYDSRTDNGYLLPTARRAGYTFGGWYKERACHTQVGPVVASPEVDMTVYAKWIRE
ncbi:MAG: InlB B-repeat-containing protein [Lachnospiraceae bacterium]|nr:InlB B-repeat-containing protein [Lachnospiraceae bacterium]